MKALLLSLALASGLHADVKNTTPVENLNGGLGGSSYGSLTYALNNALTGTSSSAIDLSGTAGLWLTLTSTASANVLVYFSNANLTYTTGATQMYILQSPGSYPIAPKARYVSFYNGATVPATRVSAFYYTVASAVTIPGTITTNDTYVAGYLTTTAAGSAARGGSITAVAVTGTVLVNITTAAGADVPCIVTIEGGTGPNAGLYWGILPSSTWVAPVTYLAVSTTPIMVTVGRGDHLQLSATAAAVTVNARVRYAPIQ
jgi:hypothetical protein